jgi:Zn-dependent membrane protease YugP
MMTYYIIAGIMFLIGTVVSNTLKRKFQEYSKSPLRNGMSGEEIALKMLHDNNIYDVKVISVDGFLSDHYNPENKTVNLSPEVFSGRTVSAAAVAAHECGHAVQHATAYNMLQLRSKMVPMVNIGSRFSQILILIGLGMVAASSIGWVFWIGIALFAVTTAFTLVTLPVEYDASNRALAWLNTQQILTPQEHTQAEDALKWAARTYVVAAISSIATLLYYVFMFMNRNSDRD